MTDTLLVDIETNGFLADVTTVHCIVARSVEMGVTYVATDHPYTPPGCTRLTIADALERMAQADKLVLHNGLGYDLPVLKKLHGYVPQPGQVIDTLIEAKLRWPRDRLMATDWAKGKSLGMPSKLYGNHSLEAFGYRMGVMKGDYTDWAKSQGITDVWAECCPEMLDYCVQDIEVTGKLYEKIKATPYSEAASAVEHVVQACMVQVTIAGFPFDSKTAAGLYAQIVDERNRLRVELSSLFPPWYQPDAKPETVAEEDGTKRKVKVPSRVVVKRTRHEGAVAVKEKYLDAGRLKTRTIKTGGVLYPEGATYTKVKLMEFNPSSRDHIVNRFQAKYGWEPTEFTDDGSACIDDTILSELAATIPEAKPLARYMLLQKRAGQLSEGNEAWLKVVGADGAVHGGYNTIGAVTRRATHSRPNIAQVPKVGSYFGAECRALFLAGGGFRLLGADLAGIELRMLAHYMAPYDGGAYAEAVVNGSSELGTDVHSLNCKALGFDPKTVYTVNGRAVKGRDIAKTFIYAFLYGAGAAKLGHILGVPEDEAKKIKARFLKALPALGKLIEAVKAKAAQTATLKGLDGGTLYVRSAHSALNTLLQSAGAIVAKYWIDEALQAYAARGWVWGRDYIIRAWIHDELQVSVRPELEQDFGHETVAAIERAGVRLALKCPITGEWKSGANWRDTH